MNKFNPGQVVGFVFFGEISYLTIIKAVTTVSLDVASKKTVSNTNYVCDHDGNTRNFSEQQLTDTICIWHQEQKLDEIFLGNCSDNSHIGWKTCRHGNVAYDISGHYSPSLRPAFVKKSEVIARIAELIEMDLLYNGTKIHSSGIDILSRMLHKGTVF